MKKLNLYYWIVTGLFVAYMVLTSIGHLLSTPDAIAFMGQLGYPAYILPFIGMAKIAGCIAIIIPGYPRIKEWAYAGLFYDLAGATFSIIAKFGVDPTIVFMILPIVFLFLSYYLSLKRMTASN